MSLSKWCTTITESQPMVGTANLDSVIGIFVLFGLLAQMVFFLAVGAGFRKIRGCRILGTLAMVSGIVMAVFVCFILIADYGEWPSYAFAVMASQLTFGTAPAWSIGMAIYLLLSGTRKQEGRKKSAQFPPGEATETDREAATWRKSSDESPGQSKEMAGVASLKAVDESAGRYTTDGALNIDNNPAERAVRAIAVGRNYAQYPIMLS